jgi:hypothetical protein
MLLEVVLFDVDWQRFLFFNLKRTARAQASKTQSGFVRRAAHISEPPAASYTLQRILVRNMVAISSCQLLSWKSVSLVEHLTEHRSDLGKIEILRVSWQVVQFVNIIKLQIAMMIRRWSVCYR